MIVRSVIRAGPLASLYTIGMIDCAQLSSEREMGGCASKPKVATVIKAEAPVPLEDAGDAEQPDESRRRSLSSFLFNEKVESSAPSETDEGMVKEACTPPIAAETEGVAEQPIKQEHPVEHIEPKAEVESLVDSSSKAEEVQTVKEEAPDTGAGAVKEEAAEKGDAELPSAL